MSNTDPKLDEYEPHRKLRFAVVGCGRIAQSHFAALKQHAARTELVAVCDVVLQALDAAVALTGAAGFASLDALLVGSDADIVVLATPSGLRPRQAIQVAQVAQAGRHVVSESRWPRSGTKAWRWCGPAAMPA